MIQSSPKRNIKVMKFTVGKYTVERLSKHGAWLITAELPADLGLLFMRPQEYYESANPEFIGKTFSHLEYMQWYIAVASDENKPNHPNSFSYFDDFAGFNIPGDVVDKYLTLTLPELTVYDVTFARIAEAVKQLQGHDNPYYIIGALSKKISTIEHEVAHSMFYLLPEYREASTKIVHELEPEVISDLKRVMAEEGYSENVMIDEIQAYMSTGLIDSMDDYESIRLPFMKLFSRWKKKFLEGKKKHKPKHKQPIPDGKPTHVYPEIKSPL